MNSPATRGPQPPVRFGGARWLNVALAAMGFLALVWLGYQTWRLLFQAAPKGAVDLLLRHGECQEWFRGVAIYETRVDAVYPPASYLVLWPLLGWSSTGFVRVFWLAPTILSTAWLCALVARHSGALDASRRRLLWVLPLASYPIGASVGNGQLSILVVACVGAGVMLVADAPRSWRRDLSIAALMLVALVKPSMSAYFFWIPLLIPGGFRAACLVVAGYALLTVAACAAQPHGPVDLIEQWLSRAAAGVRYGASVGGGAMPLAKGSSITGINLHSVLIALGQGAWIRMLSPAPLLLLGAWVFMRRRADVLILLGVAAIVARFASYHGWYDDVLLLMPLVALIRCARVAEAPRARAVAAWLALVGGLFLLAPGGTHLGRLGLPTLANVYVVSQAVFWVVAMVFLARAARSPVPLAHAVASA
ncbi:MAG: glycosyltransferase 87 family protein [Planctomycetota bacterium]|nr:glycosyltransferase 87 family protein [Planctomycetota bacterium]